MSASLRAWPRSPQQDLLEVARALGLLSALDHQFSSRLSSLYDESSPSVRWALAIASRQEAAGHVCADLRRLDAVGLTTESGADATPFSVLAANDSVEDWIEEISASSLVEVISSQSRRPTDPRPLVLDDRGRLYLRRSYESQRALAAAGQFRSGASDVAERHDDYLAEDRDGW